MYFYWNNKLICIIYRTVAASVGIYAFILSKKSINTQRYENMKARQRMREANIVD